MRGNDESSAVRITTPGSSATVRQLKSVIQQKAVMQTINPYAPTQETAADPVRKQLIASKVSSLAVAMRTIAGISLSGGVLGLGLASFMFAVPAAREPALVLYVGMAFAVGLIIAGIAACITVPVLIGMFLATRQQAGLDDVIDGPWPPQRINAFAILAGAISGYGSVVLPGAFTPSAFLLGLIPAAIGAIGTRWMARPLVRLATQERIDSQQAIAESHLSTESQLSDEQPAPPSPLSENQQSHDPLSFDRTSI